MNNLSPHPLELILRQCAQAGSEPWYPSRYAREAGVPRDSLDPYLDQLRLGGFIRLTDWIQGNGQGYALTAEGRRVLDDPQELARLRSGKVALRLEPIAPPPLEEESLTSWERGEAVRNALYTAKEPLVVRLLIGATVLWFLVGLVLGTQNNVTTSMYLSPRSAPPGHADPEGKAYGVIQHWLGALSGEALVQGEWWRLLSYAFVHGGLLHLGMNMYALFVLGRIGEQMWGRGRFLVLYLVAAVGGGVLAILYNPSIPLVGASGSICGVLAGTGAWILLNREHLPPQAVSAWMRNLGINVVLMTFISMMPGVSGLGHLGGAALGVVVGGLLNYHRFGTPAQRWLAAGGVLAVTAFCVGFLAWNMTHDPKWRRLRGVAVARASVDELFDYYLPRAQGVDKEAETLYRSEVYPLLVQPPAERDAKAIEHALAGLRQVRTRLLEVSRILKQEAGPYQHSDADQVRIHRANHLWHKAEWLALLANRLRQGVEWSVLDLATLEAKRRVAWQFDLLWREYLKALPPRAPAPSPQQNDTARRALYPHPLS